MIERDHIEGPDFIGRLADAWNGEGAHVLAPPRDQEALLRLAHLPEELAARPWRELTPPQRQRILFAARDVVNLGALCRWALGPR